MAKHMKENLSMWERTEYDIISETETETEIIGVIRNRYNAAEIICHIPKHADKEIEVLSAHITYALMQIAFTGQDISSMKSMEIKKEIPEE